MSGLSKILPRNKTARACEAVSSFCISVSSARMCSASGRAVNTGAVLTHAVLCACSGLRPMAARMLSRSVPTSPLKSVPCRLSSVDGQMLTTIISDGLMVTSRRGKLSECAAFSVFAGVSAMALGAVSGMRAAGLAVCAVAMAAVRA